MNQFVLTVIYVLSGLVGLCVGSFLNVVIYRVPEGMSIAKPNSHCPRCGYELKWYDNIPILSYVILGGKCRKCRERISFRYTAVEIANMLLWLLSAFLFVDGSVPGILYAVVAALASSVFICIFFIDLEHMLIYNRFVIATAILGVIALFGDTYTEYYDHFLGLGMAILFFVGIYYGAILVLKKEALGGGDVKLAMAAGFLLGWQKFLFAIIIASVLGSVILLILRKVKKDGKGTEYPFAPFLVSGFAVAMFFGNPILTWYTQLLLG